MPNKLKDIFKSKLTKKQLNLMPTSFDVIGDILIFSDFPQQLSKKETIIGNEILKNYKHINSVFKKIKKYSGKYRTPKLKLLAGNNKKETIYKENNTKIKLDVEKVYFSPRLGTERKRIFQQIRKNESILIMFSGSGIYPVVIAKNTKAKEIYGVEINPIAHKYALENVKFNKVDNKIKLYLGDVNRVLPKINKKFDRIIMPLPKGAENYLDLALNKTKKKAIIHFYTFSEENKYGAVIEVLNKECKELNKSLKILNISKCGQFSPRVFRICVDFTVK